MSETRDNKLVVFRMAAEGEWRLSELQQGRLRQGWGCPTLSLLDSAGKRVDKSAWTKSHCEIWGNPSPKRFSILSRMLDIREGDIVVVPKLPDRNVFTIARVNSDYRFEMADGLVNADGLSDFGHIVPVDPAKQFNYYADDDAFLISRLFRGYRDAVSFCISERHIEAASNLLDKESNWTAQQETLIEARINNSFKEAARSLQKEVKAWDCKRFQDAVKQAFLHQGYEVKETNKYDRKGGDIDILVSPPRQFSFFHSDPILIAVQVKWKQDIDQDDIVAVEQIVKGVESLKLENDAVKCVISSASGFTEEAEKEAEKNGVVLISGLQTMAFLLGFPSQWEDWEENE